MHNGCLLLLAFVAVLQPIASYTERGLVDGRQQRCDYRTTLRDPGICFHGTYRFTKPAVEDRRLSQGEDIREVRRNEVRGVGLRTVPSSDRRLVDTLERNRNTLTRPSRDRVDSDTVLRREIREGRISNHRDVRTQDTRERLSTVQESHQDLTRRDTRRRLDDRNRQQSRSDNRRSYVLRVSVESRRDTRRNGNNAEMQRVQEYREMRVSSNRARNDVVSRPSERRIAREADQRMDTRSVSRIQLNRNMDREVLDRRSRYSELRSFSMSSDRVDRAFNNEDSRPAIRDDNRSLDRIQRLTISSRRSVDELRQLRDVSRIQRQSLTERRNIRETKLRAVRSVDSLHQNDRRDTRIFERARSAENRVEVRQVRSVNEIRSLDRSAENRMDSQRSDRARVAESRNNNRDIERQSINNNRAAAALREIQNVETNLKRNAQVRSEIQNNNRDACAFERSSEQRMARMMSRERVSERNSRNMERENRGLERTNQQDAQTLRQIHSINGQRSEENRREARGVKSQEYANESRRISRNVDSRALRTVRAVENRRDSRNVDSRLVKRERTNENQRDIRNVDSRAFRTERTIETRRDAPNVDSRRVRSESSDESRRDNRNIESRAFRTERSTENRRDTRNVGSRMIRSERLEENRREVRTVDSRAFRTERTSDSRRDSRDFERQSRSLGRVAHYRRDSRNYERDARIQDMAVESRGNIRNTEAQSRIEDERVISNRRARSLERDSRSLGRESSMENRLNTQTFARGAQTLVLERRERAIENRRGTRTIRSDSRPSDTRRVESRIINMVRSRDDAKERLGKRDSLGSRRSYDLQRESGKGTRRTSERDNLATRHMAAETRGFNAEFAGKREVQNMFQSPKHQSDDEAPAINWQYLFYTLQGLYICGALIQLMDERSVEKKTRASWWPVPQHLIKVD